MNDYAYILADDVYEWLLNPSKTKRTCDELLAGLTDKGFNLVSKCIEVAKIIDDNYLDLGDRHYSSLSRKQLRALFHAVAEKYL